MFARLKAFSASLGIGAARTDGAVSLADALKPNWPKLAVNADNLGAEVKTLGRTGREQTVRTGTFAFEGPNAPVFRIDRIVEEFLGQEISTGADGKQVFRRIYEPTLKAELAGADGTRKTLSFHATRTPNVFAHATGDGERMKPFIADARSGRGEVRITLDDNGYPTEISVRTGAESKPATAKFSGYGTFPKPKPVGDSFT